jgi:hypothetical protein
MDLRRSGRDRRPAEKPCRHRSSCEKPLTLSFDIRRCLAGPRELWWSCSLINAAKYSACTAFCRDWPMRNLMKMSWMRTATSDVIVVHASSPRFVLDHVSLQLKEDLESISACRCCGSCQFPPAVAEVTEKEKGGVLSTLTDRHVFIRTCRTTCLWVYRAYTRHEKVSWNLC